MNNFFRKWWNRIIGCRRGHRDPWHLPDEHGETVGYCFACERVFWRREWNETGGEN